MSTLSVVVEILREVAPRALRAKEIATLAAGRLTTTSRTPETVVSRDLAIDVRDRGASSRFLRVGRGEFVLKEALPTAFYNDCDPYVAQWTRNLIAAGEIAPGVVDERSIRDLQPADVASYRQCHFFAGVGTWSRVLRDAEWPDEIPIFTGSCPCSPFSQAGRKKGFDDEQHLWPEWFRLIDACRPPVVVGEQVSSQDGLAWFDAVRFDLERAGYSVGVLDTCAAGAGAPHLRQRLYFVAIAGQRGCEVIRQTRLHDLGQSGDNAARCGEVDGGASGRVSDSECDGRNAGRPPLTHGWAEVEPDRHGEADGDAVGCDRDLGEADGDAVGCDCIARHRELGNTGSDGAGQYGRELPGDEAQHEERSAQSDHASVAASQAYRPGDRVRLVDDPSWGGAVRGYWAQDVEWIYCRPAPGHEDGCFRPAESGTQPLVDESAPGMGRTRAARLRGYGNAIVKEQAVEFIKTVIDVITAAKDAVA